MLQLRDVTKTYVTEGFTQLALDGVSLDFRDSEFVAILGPSGSGKTTLLNILGGLDHPNSGELVVNGVSTRNYRDKDWDAYRNHHVGFVFQSYNLIAHQSVLSNVELALTLSGASPGERRERARAALDAVGLAEHASKRPSQLSGGQMQRVAIARALVNNPDIVLADEPTGALDSETGVQVMDILKEVAKDRLVVMVTHNPELAEAYATRIVRLKDGRVTDDTNPVMDATANMPAREGGSAPEQEPVGVIAATGGAAGGEAGGASGGTSGTRREKRASMSFLTALSLSFNNLMTKKGRTFMTAFAGSIGIIGIAAILALSNGVNNYINKTEEEALSSYPLTITKSSFDLSSIISYRTAALEAAGTDASTTAVEGSDTIEQRFIMTDMFAQVKNNDLSAFKAFLESGDSGIEPYVNAVEYSYGITPQIYMSDTSDGITRLNPSNLSSTLSNGVMGSALTGGSSMGSFTQLVDNEDLLKSNATLVYGSWPKAYDEAVLILDQQGELSDYTLYSLGFYDPAIMDRMTEDALGGQEVTTPEDEERDFTYEDALGMTFSVVPAANLYQKNESQGTWTDMSGDEDYMRRQIADGIQLKIVGVIMPSSDAGAALAQEGVGYTSALTQELIERAASSQIVQEQLADPDVDVFTGTPFEELWSSQNEFDLENLFSVDEDALAGAFSIDTGALASADMGNMDFSGVSLDTSAIDFSSIQIDTSVLDGLLSQETVEAILANAPGFADYLDSQGGELPEISEGQQQLVVGYASQAVSSYMSWREGLAEGEDSSFAAWQQTDEAQQLEDSLRESLGEEEYAELEGIVQGYLSYLAEYLEAQVGQLVTQAAQLMTTELSSQLTTQLAAMTGSVGSQLSSAVASQISSQMSQLSSALENGFSVDAQAFQDAIQINMTQEDLTSLLMNYLNSDQLTYDSNMATLGYADLADPESISIYPKDFEAKEQVIGIIDTYNDARREAGEDDKTIQYSDIAGTLMSSVTDIVNMISAVLIAFVSISLVVSSIMIGVITYISVLERRKEIGILRAMGASKLNVANVFNAETIIEGLISGVIAILVTLVAEVPVNHLVYQWRDVENIMILPWRSALILIGISVLLTFLGGLIPSTRASRNDPAESLRSE